MAGIFLSRIFLSASWFLRNADRKIRDRKIEPVKPIGRAATTINRQGGELQNPLRTKSWWAKSSRQESIHLITKLDRRAEHPGLAASVAQLRKVRRAPLVNFRHRLLDSRPSIVTRWCNGNTAGFGPAIPGSSPGRVIGYLCSKRHPAESLGNARLFAFLGFQPVAQFRPFR